jgi:hypothetical protein
MSWADAMANPANNAAVLTSNCFLMEWSSSSWFAPRADPCGSVQGKTTWIMHSSDTALDFVRRVGARFQRFVWNQ